MINTTENKEYLSSNSIGWIGFPLDDQENIQNTLHTFFAKSIKLDTIKGYIDSINELFLFGCKETNSNSFLIDIRINSSISGPRRHIDGNILGNKGVKNNYQKYAIALEGPSPYILGPINPDVYDTLKNIQNDITKAFMENNFQETVEEKILQDKLNDSMPVDAIQKSPSHTIVKRDIGGDHPTFHSEPVLDFKENRIFVQIIPCDKNDLSLLNT